MIQLWAGILENPGIKSPLRRVKVGVFFFFSFRFQILHTKLGTLILKFF
jgi:hypothetical protein